MTNNTEIVLTNLKLEPQLKEISEYFANRIGDYALCTPPEEIIREAIDAGINLTLTKLEASNWNSILKETRPLFGNLYKRDDELYKLIGVVDGGDDYYYLMVDKNNKCRLLSCVGSIENFGFNLL